MRVMPAVLSVALGAAALAPLQATGAQGAPDVTLSSLLSSAAAYLETYQQKFSAVVAHEDYELVYTPPPPTVVGGMLGRPQDRLLSSDVMMLNLGPAEWVQFRDVSDVDGKPVRGDANRLATILASPASGVLTAARAVADESARYNIGVSRNFNVPTMALAYVERRSQPHSSFSLKGRETIDGVQTVVLAFQETVTPGLIRATNGKVQTHGRMWIEPETGAIRRTELECRIDRAFGWVTGTVTVSYAPEAALKLLVPVRMDEQYQRQSGEHDSGRATYTKFRAFNVDTSAIRRGGGMAAVNASPQTTGERP